MKIFALFSAGLVALAAAKNYDAGYYAGIETKVELDYGTAEDGGYDISKSSYGEGRESSYSIPHFEFPPLGVRIKAHIEHCGKDLRNFFRKVHHALGAILGAIIDAFKSLVDKIKSKFACAAARLHYQFRKCKSDWERVKFWAKAHAHHFKFWLQYEKACAEGKVRIFTRYAHDALCAFRKFREEMKEEYSKQVKACEKVKDTEYQQNSVIYIETVGYPTVEAPYGKDKPSYDLDKEE